MGSDTNKEWMVLSCYGKTDLTLLFSCIAVVLKEPNENWGPIVLYIEHKQFKINICFTL